MMKNVNAFVDYVDEAIVAKSKLPSTITSTAVYGAIAAAAGAGICALFGIGFGFGKGLIADVGTILTKSVKK
jgi:hypothetical protein